MRPNILKGFDKMKIEINIPELYKDESILAPQSAIAKIIAKFALTKNQTSEMFGNILEIIDDRQKSTEDICGWIHEG